MRSLLAIIGLVVVVQKGYAFYRDYQDLKRAQAYQALTP